MAKHIRQYQRPASPLRLLSIAVAVAGLGAASASRALEWQGYVGAEFEHTDNSLQSATNEQSDLERALVAGLQARQQSTALDAQIDYMVDAVDFADDTQESSTRLSGEARASWHILPEKLDWNFRHTRRDEVANSRQVDITDDREKRDLFSTGPSLRLNLTNHDTLGLNAEVARLSGDESVTENDRLSAGASWMRLINPLTDAVLSLQHTEVDYDERAQQDLTFDRASLQVVRRIRDGRIELTGGVNRSERDGGDSDTSPLWRVYGEHSALGHTFSVAYVDELTDSSVGLDDPDFAQGPVGGGGILPGDNFDPDNGNFDVADIVHRKTLDVRYQTTRLCDVCTPTVRLYMDDEDFDRSLRDEREVGVELGLDYRWTERFSTRVGYRHSVLDYPDDPDDREDTREESYLEARYELFRNVQLTAMLAHETRESDVDSADYTENRILLGVRYAFGGGTGRP